MLRYLNIALIEVPVDVDMPILSKDQYFSYLCKMKGSQEGHALLSNGTTSKGPADIPIH